MDVNPEDYELFLTLFSSSQPQVRMFIRSLVPAADQADDVFQATSLTLWRSFSTFRRDGDFLAWAIGVARHQVLVHWRKRRRDRHVFNEALIRDLADDAERAAELGEARMQALEACMRRLSERQLELVRLFYGEKARAESIAAGWKRSVHAVYKALRVMRQKLAECVRQQLILLGEAEAATLPIHPSGDSHPG